MTKTETYRTQLRALAHWDEFLLKHSGLPGPRGNIELAQTVADEGDRGLFERCLTFTADVAPVNSPYEFLAFCGVVGLGRLLAEGDDALIAPLRQAANDSRWRMREGVAMALQRLGDVDMERLLTFMQEWRRGTFLEQRAAAAALCEPRLLKRREHAEKTLRILDDITTAVVSVTDRRSDDFMALRKGLSYCWSVAVVALPEVGKPLMEKWFGSTDQDIRRIMRENLKKNRLRRMDVAWVEKMENRLNHAA